MPNNLTLDSPPIGRQSAVINGQLVPVPSRDVYNPLIFGPVYNGAGWPRQGVYTVPPVPPPSNMSPGPTDYTMSNSMPTNQDEKGNPYSLRKSPVIWVIVFLVASLAMLHYVHYGE